MVITETKHSPYFILDKERGFILLKGKSTLTATRDFYKPIIEEINDYVDNNPVSTRMIVDLEYFNTSSSKLILEIFLALKKLMVKEIPIVVEWYYEDDDEDMYESGTDYSEILRKVSFNFIIKE